jgi:phytoene synthase
MANPAAPGEAIIAAARAGEPDRYLSALLAPAPARSGLLALAAFLSELGRIPEVVGAPATGEIRLQWWREALALPPQYRTGSPIADALREVARAQALPQALLEDVIDAHAGDLLPAALADEAALQAYLWKREGVAFLLGARVLARAPDALEAAAATGGRAYGLARLLLKMARKKEQARPPRAHPTPQTEGDVPPPASPDPQQWEALLGELSADARRHLAACRQHLADLPKLMRPAFLPLALVAPYLRALERKAGEPAAKDPVISPLTRVSRIAIAHWLGP